MNDLLDRLFGLSAQARLGIYAVVVLLLGFLYWNFFYAPAALEISERSARLDELKAQRLKKERMVAQLDRLRIEVRELDARLNKAIAELPDSKEIPALLSQVSQLGKESGLDILLFRQRPEAVQDFYAEVPVEMLMRGSYADLTRFFDRVGEMDRIVNVKDIAIKSPKVTADGRVTLDTSCTAVTFRFLSEEERARIAAEKARQQK